MNLFRTAALGAVAVLSLTACGGGTGADKPADGSGASGSGGAASVTSIKLVAAEYSKDNTKAFWDQFAKDYKAKTGITLEVQIVPWENIDASKLR